MNADQSRDEFVRSFTEAGLAIDQLTAPQAVDAMLGFYRNHRAEDCLVDADGDMLLYQWGQSNLDGEDCFELDLTRQFIRGEDADDKNIWQLSLTLKFSPIDKMRNFDSGNKWCPVPRPQAVDYFQRFIQESVAYQTVSNLQAIAVELNYSNAG